MWQSTERLSPVSPSQAVQLQFQLGLGHEPGCATFTVTVRADVAGAGPSWVPAPLLTFTGTCLSTKPHTGAPFCSCS